MIPTQTLVQFPEFATGAAAKNPPGSAKYAAGFQPADVLPAEWLNYFENKSSAGITTLNSGVASIEAELNNLITQTGGTPTQSDSTQVYTAVTSLRDAITGYLNSLTTTAKSTLVAAINELVTNQGSLESLSTTAKTTLVAAINEIKNGLGTAAGKTAGKASGNVPLIGSTALGTTQNTIIVNDGAGALKDSGLKVGTGANNIPQIGTALGTTDSNIVVTDANGKLKPSGTVIGSAAGKTAGSGNGNVPLNGASLGSTDYNAICTNASGALKTYDKTLPQIASYGYYCSETPTITNNIATYALTNLTGLSIGAGSVLRVCFSKALNSVSAISQVKLTFGGQTAPIKVPRGNGSDTGGLVYLKSHKFTGGTYTSTSPHRVFDPFTCFELVYNGTDWVIMNNTTVCSHYSTSKSYRVYADGYIEQWGTKAISSGSGASESFYVQYTQNPNVTAAINPSSLDASERNMFQVYSISTTSFNVYGNFIASSCNAQWCAKGY